MYVLCDKGPKAQTVWHRDVTIQSLRTQCTLIKPTPSSLVWAETSNLCNICETWSQLTVTKSGLTILPSALPPVSTTNSNRTKLLKNLRHLNHQTHAFVLYTELVESVAQHMCWKHRRPAYVAVFQKSRCRVCFMSLRLGKLSRVRTWCDVRRWGLFFPAAQKT